MSSQFHELREGANKVPTTMKQKTQGTSPVIEIDEHNPGDLILKVGEDNESKLLRVHSTNLKQASLVFRMLLGTRWKEGLKVYTEADPLLLQDDNPSSFHDLCKIIHHQVNGRDEIQASQLPGLAKIADKYDCCAKLQPWFWARLGPLFESNMKPDESGIKEHDLSVQDIMCVAYIVGDAQLFWRSSRHALTRADVVTLADEISPELLECKAGLLSKEVAMF